LRLAEIEEVYFVLSMIRNGKGKDVADKNLRRSGHVESSSQGLDGVDWTSWTERLLLEQVTIAGHSFGGATAVEVLRHTDRFHFVGQGIIYDIWGAAIQPPGQEVRNRIQRPFLCINSEAFMYWSNNFEAVFTLCEEAKANGALSWLMTIRGTVHLSLSDFSVLYPRIFSLLLKTTANSHRAILLHVSASIEFLKLVMLQSTSAISPIDNEELLNIVPLQDLPDERKPTNKKWIAMRLRIPHEMTLRLKPRIVRRHTNRKHARQAGTALPKDPAGKEIYALGTFTR
jgi:platelet-activating factor acetylhydrolase